MTGITITALICVTLVLICYLNNGGKHGKDN